MKYVNTYIVQELFSYGVCMNTSLPFILVSIMSNSKINLLLPWLLNRLILCRWTPTCFAWSFCNCTPWAGGCWTPIKTTESRWYVSAILPCNQEHWSKCALLFLKITMYQYFSYFYASHFYVQRQSLWWPLMHLWSQILEVHQIILQPEYQITVKVLQAEKEAPQKQLLFPISVQLLGAGTCLIQLKQSTEVGHLLQTPKINVGVLSVLLVCSKNMYCVMILFYFFQVLPSYFKHLM